MCRFTVLYQVWRPDSIQSYIHWIHVTHCHLCPTRYSFSPESSEAFEVDAGNLQLKLTTHIWITNKANYAHFHPCQGDLKCIHYVLVLKLSVHYKWRCQTQPISVTGTVWLSLVYLQLSRYIFLVPLWFFSHAKSGQSRVKYPAHFPNILSFSKSTPSIVLNLEEDKIHTFGENI